MAKTIKAVFGVGELAKTCPQWQYDYNTVLQFVGLDLPATYEVDLANSKTGQSVTVLGNADGCTIPAQFFIPGTTIYAWVFIAETDSGYTRAQVEIPISPRAVHTGDEPTPEQQDALDQAIALLNAATEAIPDDINAALAEAKASGEFDGADGQDGLDGNAIWRTNEEPTSETYGAFTFYFYAISDLNGADGRSVQVGDLVLKKGNYLYWIASTQGDEECEVREIGSIKGDTGATGQTGPAGQDGSPGQDGVSPTISSSSITGGHRLTITDANGTTTVDVMDGATGQTGPAGPAGPGVPSGGSTGQVLKKKSGTNYDTEWANESGGGTSDYSDLTNKPQINSVTLSGNKSLSDLGIQPNDFIVTITYDSGNDSYSADKTFAQIKTAKQAGKNVILKYGDPTEFYRVAVWVSDPLEFAVFSFNQGTAVNQIMIDETDLVLRTVGSAGTYSKPSGGIPASDLASAVQTSLGKADTALQSAPVTSVNSQTGAVTLGIPSTAADVGAIPAPSSPTTGDFLCWNGSAWAATSLSTWQGGNY